LFRETRNYLYFLKLYAKYIEPVAETYAYCLLGNHFHLLVRIREIGPVSETGPILNASRQFNNLFIAYAKAFNKAYQRTGGLFESPFKRKRVDNDRYFTALVTYIHRNPQAHGFVDAFQEWPYSSYRAVLSDLPSHIQRDIVLGWFADHHGFEEAHSLPLDEATIAPLIEADWM